jgi:predicted metal-binding protein
MMRKKKPAKQYIDRAVKLGALAAKQIDARTIVTGSWVRIKCQYGCGGYGRCLTCPPYSPRPEETARMLEEYEMAVLIHGDDHVDVTGIAAKIEREAFLDGYYKAFAMGCGPCMLCDECDVENGECPHPAQARPAMEACGVDVFQTVRANGFPLEVVRRRDCRQNYYAVVLIE